MMIQHWNVQKNQSFLGQSPSSLRSWEIFPLEDTLHRRLLPPRCSYISESAPHALFTQRGRYNLTFSRIIFPFRWRLSITS